MRYDTANNCQDWTTTNANYVIKRGYNKTTNSDWIADDTGNYGNPYPFKCVECNENVSDV
jgi:hypothetical protein